MALSKAVSEHEIVGCLQAALCDRFKHMPEASYADFSRYWTLPYPQRLYVLADLVKWNILREAGDIELYLKLADSIAAMRGGVHLDKFIVDMARWLKERMHSMPVDRSQTPRRKFAMSVMLWGTRYTTKCVETLFRSWLADGNMPFLGNACRTLLHMHVDDEAYEVLKAHPVMHKLQDLGLNVFYDFIPRSLIDQCDYDQAATYWLVGMSASLGLCFARRNDASFHHVVPDSVYSNKYFKELVRLSESHAAVLQNGFRTDETLMKPMLGRYTRGAAVDIPATALVAESLNNIHMYGYYQFVNHRQKDGMLPMAPYIIWEGRDRLYLHATHTNLVYISYNSIKGLKDRYYQSLDSEIDLIIDNNNFYMQREEDELFSAELSPPDQFKVSDSYETLERYCTLYYTMVIYRDMMPFFKRGQIIPFDPALRKGGNPMPEYRITHERQELLKAIVEADPWKAVRKGIAC